MGLAVEKIRTLGRLGLGNIARVAAYRFSLKFPFSPIRTIADHGGEVSGPFFKSDTRVGTSSQPVPLTAPSPLPVPVALPKMFGYHDIGTTTEPPKWLVNPLNGQSFTDAARPFYAIADFDPAVGDIKQIWELSRFQWVLELAQDPTRISMLNDWISDWTAVNPAYVGPNWKCGQEASLRVLHLIVGAYLCGDCDAPLPGLTTLIGLHLKRIAPTVSYALAQDNNHGTSEAAALYIGGTWLAASGDKDGEAWAKTGRRLLENRAKKLIQPDGSFSQYSVTYHRMMLDSLSLCEWWRARCGDRPFSELFQSRAQAAAQWLYRLTDPITGDAPNIGANDGAHIINIAGVDYRDFRSSVALSYALWHGTAAFADHAPSRGQLALLGVEVPTKLAPIPQADAGLNGGFAVLKTARAMAVLRCPRFAFRPSQSDILHVDFWHDGHNILRDGGTYSYNSTDADLAYFGGAAAHNTISFDGRDQMPRLGRFLFGAWPVLKNWAWSEHMVRAGYEDYAGAKHSRAVTLEAGLLRTTDDIAGFDKAAVLRWRFSPDLCESLPPITKTGHKISVDFGRYQLEISGETVQDAAWETGRESRYYWQASPLPVLAVSADKPGTIVSELRWTP